MAPIETIAIPDCVCAGCTAGATLRGLAKGRRAPVKQVLLDQRRVLQQRLGLPARPKDIPGKQACAAVVREVGGDGLRDMGRCMNALKEKFPGKMDFGKASGIVKNMLQ